MGGSKNNSGAQDRLTNCRKGYISFYSLLITCLVLFLALGASDAGDSFIRHLNKIGENLDKALSTAMEVKSPNYTSIYVNVTYQSNPKYNPRGLGEVYNITKAFMRLILKEATPRDVFSVERNRLKVNVADHWFDLILQYAFIILICLIVVLLGVIMPVCGVFFCCCRCCGKCGARSRPYDKKHDLCRRFYLASLLIVCGTLLLFGVVCAFVTNQRLEEGIQNLPKDLKTLLHDTNKFLNNTDHQINTLAKTNFDEFYATISESLDECSVIVFDELEQISNATSMDDISNITKQFPNIRKDYGWLKNSTTDLRMYASQLDDAVRRIKKELLDVLQECIDIEQCKNLYNDIANLQTKVDFDKLPDINAQIKDLDRILQSTNIDDILKGEEKLKQIQKDIQRAVKENTEKAKEKIGEVGRTLAKNANELSSTIKDLMHDLNQLEHDRRGRSDIEMLQKVIEQFDPYRHYLGITICCILLAITCFVALGLICGICGKRPGGYGDDCCNKGSGSQFLLCAVMFMFFFTCVIACATLVYFLVGMTMQEAACKSLKAPKSSQLFKLVDQFNLTMYWMDGKISDVIERCHKNQSVYEVFEMKKKFNIDQIRHYIDDFDIEKVLNDLDKMTGNVNFDNFVLLTPDQIRELKRISNSDFANVDFSKFLDELNANFTSIDFTVIRKELQDAIEKVKDLEPSASRLQQKLDSVLYQLGHYEETVILPMQKTADLVRVTATSLEKKLHLGHNSFQEGMNSLIANVVKAQDTLRQEGPKMIREAATDFAQNILKQCKKYMERVIFMVKGEVGRCGPISNAYNATLTTACDKIALQMNGFWFTLLCSMLVFLPTIVISVKLAILYQKQVPFSDYYVETGRGGKPKRKKNNRRREDRSHLTPRSGNTELAPRDVAGGSAHQDARYSDMAPKNWEEFPAGGPPQYQRAPTEYERPPPYYYPGTTTEQP